MLIECYLKFKGLIGQGNNTRKSLVDKIAVEFNKPANIKVTGEQFVRKYKKMETKQKVIEGNNRQTWKCHKEMEQCIDDKAGVTPTYKHDSGCNTSLSAHSHSPQTIYDISYTENDSLDSEDVKGKTAVDPELRQRWQMKRKRKSVLSAEMLRFFRDY